MITIKQSFNARRLKTNKSLVDESKTFSIGLVDNIVVDVAGADNVVRNVDIDETPN